MFLNRFKRLLGTKWTSRYTSTYEGLTGGQVIVKELQRKGVQDIIGYSGGAIMGVFDALYDNPMNLLISTHEQSLGHIACGYTKSSGKIPVCLVTSGPGLTNMITPMLDSHNDSTPMIVISGNVPLKYMGTQAFQECPATRITETFCKWSVLVTDVNMLPCIMDEAWHIATSGKPGCVHIDLPKCVANGIYSTRPEFFGDEDEILTEALESDDVMLVKVATLLNTAKRPVVIVGKGCNAYPKELLDFVCKANVPVTSTIHAVGTFPEDHPLSMKWLGMHGLACANYAVSESDLIINIGARFDDRTIGDPSSYGCNARWAFRAGKGGIVHVNIDRTEFNKTVSSHYNFQTDCKVFLDEILALVSWQSRTEWLNKIGDWKQKYPFDYDRTPGKGLRTQAVIETINLHLPKEQEWKIATGVGNHQMWAAQFIEYKKPNTLLTSGSLGVMGAGIGYAIGAQLANPDSLVVLIDGDGSFNMTLSELRTVAKHQLPIKIALMNDGQLSMVRVWEELFFAGRYVATDLSGNPDYPALAKSFGIESMMCDSEDDLESSVRRFLMYPGPILCDFRTIPDMCYPLVSPGKPLNDMILFQEKGATLDMDRSNAPS